MHAIMVAESSDDDGHILIHDRNSNDNLIYMAKMGGSNIAHGQRLDTNNVETASNVWDTSQAGIISSVIRDDASGALSVDGGSVNNPDNVGDGVTFGNELTIGSQDNESTAFWDGELAELVIWDRELTADEQTGVLSILADKWGTASVSATEEQIAAGQQALAIPEPASLALLGLGGLMMLPRRRRR